MAPKLPLLLLLWTAFSATSLGQTIILEGKLVNAKTREPVPFGNLYIKDTGLGTSSNLEGQFTLKLPPRLIEEGYSLNISCIGFQSLEQSLADLNSFGNVEFILTPATTTLDELVIGSKRNKSNIKAGIRIVSRAFQRIPKNYPKGNFKLETFYRHYCKEDEEYGRLIEAAVSLYDTKGYSQFHTLPPDKVSLKVEQLRRSYDFTGEAKNYHTPIALNFIFSQEITSYLYKNRLKEDLSNFEFEIIDTTSLEDRPVFVISFKQMKGFQRNETGLSGELYVDAVDFAFVRVKSKTETTRESPRDSSYLVLNRTQNYRRFEGKYFANHLISDGFGDYSKYDSLGNQTTTWNHSAHVEVLATNILLGKGYRFEGKEPTKEQLLYIEFDSVFWDNYNILRATPLEEQIERDLAHKAPLQQQFKTYNLVHGGGESILENPQMKNLLSQYQGTAIYAVIWSSASYPNFFELTPISYLRSKIKRGKMTYLFISTDEDEDEWNQTRGYQQLDIPDATHRRIPMNLGSYISEQYYSNSFPMFLLLDTKGEMVSEDALRPNNPLLKDQLKPLLKRAK